MVRIKVNHLLPLLLFLLFFTSCARKYKIEGTSSITSLDGKMLYLKQYQGENVITVDSAEIVHGYFKMNGVADSVKMVTLYMGDEALMPLVLEKGKIKVTISNLQIQAEGTPLNDKLYAFIDKQSSMQIRLSELERKEARMVLDGGDLDKVRSEVKKEAEDLVKEMNAHVKQFIIDNYETVLGPCVFVMMCSSMPYPAMTPEVEELMRTAPMSFKNDPMVQEFLTQAKENMKQLEEQQRLKENVIVAQQQQKDKK